MNKLIILCFISLFFSRCSLSQDIDRINIYFIPFEADFFVDNLDGNDVRVKAEYQFTILLDSKIKQIHKALKDMRKELVETVELKEFKQCRLVIDLISRSNIEESYIFNTSYNFIVDEVYTKVPVYKGDEAFLCYLRSLFPDFIYIMHKDIKCVE